MTRKLGSLVDDDAVEMIQPLQFSFVVEISGDLIPDSKDVGLEDEAEEEEEVETGQNEKIDEGRWTRHGQAGLRVTGETEPTTGVEALQKYVEKFDYDSLSGDDQIEAVASGHVETRLAVSLDERQDPVKREIEGVDGAGDEEV